MGTVRKASNSKGCNNRNVDRRRNCFPHKAVLRGVGMSRANSYFVAEAVNTDEEMDKSNQYSPGVGQALRERLAIKTGRVLYSAVKSKDS